MYIYTVRKLYFNKLIFLKKVKLTKPKDNEKTKTLFVNEHDYRIGFRQDS